MAKVLLNELTKALRGRIGGLVFRQMPDGSVVVSTPPHYGRRRKYSNSQKQHQSRFQRATMYARSAAKAYPIYAELARGTVKSAYNFALSDWFKPPVIHEIRHRDGRILVRASDNVMVKKLVIQVLGEENQVLEKGEATRHEGDWWEYIPNVGGKTISAEAWDLARNHTLSVFEMHPAIGTN